MSIFYKLIKHIKIKYADPICALDLNKNILLFGSMLGYTGYYLINENVFSILSEKQDENISAVKIRNEDLIIVVGDLQILFYKKDLNYTREIIKEIYELPGDHSKNCENAYTMLGSDYLFRIILSLPSSEKTPSEYTLCLFAIKDIVNGGYIEGKLEISNYWVPFDFDGKNLIYIDFLEEFKRVLNIFNFHANKKIVNIDLDKTGEFLGHISHIKKINDQCIFLVHSYINCEIRNLEFKILKSFIHKGKEIIACDIYYNNNEFYIILLDKNGDISLYNNREEMILFNINESYDISDEIKNQKFFAMEYPYYIKMYENLIAVTTDQGCFLFKKRA